MHNRWLFEIFNFSFIERVRNAFSTLLESEFSRWLHKTTRLRDSRLVNGRRAKIGNFHSHFQPLLLLCFYFYCVSSSYSSQLLRNSQKNSRSTFAFFLFFHCHENFRVLLCAGSCLLHNRFENISLSSLLKGIREVNTHRKKEDRKREFSSCWQAKFTYESRKFRCFLLLFMRLLMTWEGSLTGEFLTGLKTF